MTAKWWESVQCCGSCAHWDIESARTKSGAVRADRYVWCDVLPADVLPHSVRERPWICTTPTSRDQGNGCVCYVRREPSR